jgi:hypothetical protein
VLILPDPLACRRAEGKQRFQAVKQRWSERKSSCDDPYEVWWIAASDAQQMTWCCI